MDERIRLIKRRLFCGLLAGSLMLSLIPLTQKDVRADETDLTGELSEVPDDAADVINAVPKIQRNYISLAGKNRYETAAAMASSSFDTGLPGGEVVIVTGKNFPDALSAAGYAGVAQAPILLSALDKLSPATKDALTNTFKYTLSKVTVIGSGFEDGFYNDLKALGFSEKAGNLKKIGGKNRYKTAEAVTEATLKLAASKSIPIYAVAVTTGEQPYDALSFGPWARTEHVPVLLVKGGKASDSTKAMIARFPYVYLLGDESVCSESCLSEDQASGLNYTRLAGPNRYKTSQEIASFFIDFLGNGTYAGTAFADGTENHYIDALAGSTFTYAMARWAAPIILTCEGSKGEKNVKDFVVEKYAGTESEDYYFFFLGWTAEGKSSEYGELTKWIESKD